MTTRSEDRLCKQLNESKYSGFHFRIGAGWYSAGQPNAHSRQRTTAWINVVHGSPPDKKISANCDGVLNPFLDRVDRINAFAAPQVKCQ
jgi:hypothetical protein